MQHGTIELKNIEILSTIPKGLLEKFIDCWEAFV
nr:MAG TPA: hypothetical protein [Caudoviricetes sp.]